MILDGRRIAAATLVAPAADPRASSLAFYAEPVPPPLDQVAATAEPLVAEVNHGIWIAPCSCGARNLPAPGCVVFLALPLGWCIRCQNRAWGGGWRRIVVPPEDERAAIEAALLVRPDPMTRNWLPGETVADLLRENDEHDVDGGDNGLD
jgi:hypothetical protein